MTPPFVLFLILMFYCTSGIRAMSIQHESDHTQLDDLRQTVADLSTKIEVLNETMRKGLLMELRSPMPEVGEQRSPMPKGREQRSPMPEGGELMLPEPEEEEQRFPVPEGGHEFY